MTFLPNPADLNIAVRDAIRFAIVAQELRRTGAIPGLIERVTCDCSDAPVRRVS